MILLLAINLRCAARKGVHLYSVQRPGIFRDATHRFETSIARARS